MEITSSQISIVIPGEKRRTSRYQVLSQEADEVELGVETEPGVQISMRFIVEEESELRWLVDQERTLLLKREP